MNRPLFLLEECLIQSRIARAGAEHGEKATTQNYTVRCVLGQLARFVCTYIFVLGYTNGGAYRVVLNLTVDTDVLWRVMVRTVTSSYYDTSCVTAKRSTE